MNWVLVKRCRSAYMQACAAVARPLPDGPMQGLYCQEF